MSEQIKLLDCPFCGADVDKVGDALAYLEKYFHDHGELFKLPEDINGAIMDASAHFAVDYATRHAAERERVLRAEVERLTAEVNALSADRFDDQKAHENRLDQWRLDNEN